MKTKKIIECLKDIEQISKFQQERIKDKKSINKEIILKHALNILESHIISILGELE